MIPALQEADCIRAAVGSARAPGVEILVVDGGSRDATRELAREAGARVIGSEPGRARQLAAGVDATAAGALLFLHADTSLPAGYASSVLGALTDPEVVGGAFRFRFAREGALSGLRRALLRTIEWGVAWRLRLFELPYGDQALFVRRSALERAGGVPQAPILEDLDLVRALKRSGRLVLLSASVTTSPRRYLERGPLRSVLRNAGILAGDALGIDRARLAAWYRA